MQNPSTSLILHIPIADWKNQLVGARGGFISETWHLLKGPLKCGVSRVPCDNNEKQQSFEARFLLRSSTFICCMAFSF